MRAKHARRQYRPPSRAATKTLGRCPTQKEGPAVPNSPPIPLLKPLTSARLPVSGVRQASASTCDSESSEAKKQAAGQSLSLKSSIAAPVITSIVDTCLSHRGHKTQQWIDRQAAAARTSMDLTSLFPVWRRILTEVEEDPATGFYIFILLPPSLHVCTVAISDIEMAPLVIPTIPTTPSLAIPAPWSSDKCSSPLPPDHLAHRRATRRGTVLELVLELELYEMFLPQDHLDRRRATGRRRESTRRSQIWWGRHICSNPSRFFNQIGRKLTAVLPR